jgi:hypothetical protein
MLEMDLEFWVYLSCLVGPSILLTATLFYFLKLIKRLNHPVEAKEKCDEYDKSAEFTDEVRFQIIGQQVDLALENAMTEINEQRIYIQNLIAGADPAQLRPNSSFSKSASGHPALFQASGSVIADTVDCDENQAPSAKISDAQDHPVEGDPYDQIVALCTKGLKSDEIAEQLGINRAEVDLFIQLRVPEAYRMDKEAIIYKATA